MSKFDGKFLTGIICHSAGQQIINSKAFNPVAIFRAVKADGAAEPEQTKGWQPMRFRTDS